MAGMERPKKGAVSPGNAAAHKSVATVLDCSFELVHNLLYSLNFPSIVTTDSCALCRKHFPKLLNSPFVSYSRLGKKDLDYCPMQMYNGSNAGCSLTLS